MENGGEKRVFLVFLLRGERGWILVGPGCFLPRSTKNKSPKLGRKRGVSVKWHAYPHLLLILLCWASFYLLLS